ncbi:MAG: class I SAM-dependent methyltransferase [Anaerolineae bacterium]|nr:class I SAM-dependent methyltransferase [Anaerolineae bacterium]
MREIFVRILRPWLPFLNRILYLIKFFLEFGYPAPPVGTDLAGYDKLLRVINNYELLEIDGDFVEIGTFLGGGTYKLAKFLEVNNSNKKVYAIDIFEMNFDQTLCTTGTTMAKIYQGHVVKNFGEKTSQLDIFKKVTQDCNNIELIIADTMDVRIPAEFISFGFIDGNHDPLYVKNDFYLVWNKLSAGGVVAFDDYGHDLPQVTNMLNDLVDKHQSRIKATWQLGRILFIQKKGS